MTKNMHKFLASLAGGAEDCICIQYAIEDCIDYALFGRDVMLCEIVSILLPECITDKMFTVYKQ